MTAGMANPTLQGSPCCVPVDLRSFPEAGACTKERCSSVSHLAGVLGSQKAARRGAALQGIVIIFHCVHIFALQTALVAPGWVRSWVIQPKGSCRQQCADPQRGLWVWSAAPSSSHPCTPTEVLLGAVLPTPSLPTAFNLQKQKVSLGCCRSFTQIRIHRPRRWFFSQTIQNDCSFSHICSPAFSVSYRKRVA